MILPSHLGYTVQKQANGDRDTIPTITETLCCQDFEAVILRLKKLHNVEDVTSVLKTKQICRWASVGQELDDFW